MLATIRFTPELVVWWPLLMGIRGRLGRIHRWEPAGRGPTGGSQVLEQHPTDTLVLCLQGSARVEDGRTRLDLAAGDALVLRPGTWHRHAPIRRGSLHYQQGVVAGRSDFFIADDRLRVSASWPEQPSWRMLSAIGASADEDGRRHGLAALLEHLATESAEPVPAEHPAVLAMEYTMWQQLHRPDTVARIVAASGLSRVQAYRLFGRHWGMGIAAAVRRARLIWRAT